MYAYIIIYSPRDIKDIKRKKNNYSLTQKKRRK